MPFIGMLFGVALAATPQTRAKPKPAPPLNMADILRQAARGIDSDICFPANSTEYQALGKNGILMLTSQAANATELPLRSVYALFKGVRIPLQRVGLVDSSTDDEGRTVQVSFYLLPLHLMKQNAELKADFTGPRTGFGFMTFSAGVKDENMPVFARLDEYDEPQEADLATVATVIAREYPDFAGRVH